MTENKKLIEFSLYEFNTAIVSKTKTKKIKRKNSYNNGLQIDIKTLELAEELNRQADRVEVEAKKLFF